jgi:hypothetical protein
LHLHGVAHASVRWMNCAMEAEALPARAATGSNIRSSWLRRRLLSHCCYAAVFSCRPFNTCGTPIWESGPSGY